MLKKCNYCKEAKPLDEYFTATNDAAASWHGTSEYCKQCHSDAKIPHGYGWYGDKYKTPSETPINRMG